MSGTETPGLSVAWYWRNKTLRSAAIVFRTPDSFLKKHGIREVRQGTFLKRRSCCLSKSSRKNNGKCRNQLLITRLRKLGEQPAERAVYNSVRNFTKKSCIAGQVPVDHAGLRALAACPVTRAAARSSPRQGGNCEPRPSHLCECHRQGLQSRFSRAQTAALLRPFKAAFRIRVKLGLLV